MLVVGRVGVSASGGRGGSKECLWEGWGEEYLWWEGWG